MADVMEVGSGDRDGGENKRNEKENFPNSVLEAETMTGMQKDGDAQKNREREERLRLARQRQKEEQRRKMAELRDAMLRAEEFRKRQEEERRRKIEEMKKREVEHRATVEERRKKLLDEENERKQAILRRTTEREVKLEQAKSKKMCASGATSIALRSANSSQNISHPSRTGSVLHVASSVRDIHNGWLVQQNRDGDHNSSTAATVAPFSTKLLSASTGHLLKIPQRKTDDGNLRSLAPSADVVTVKAKSGRLVEDVLHPLGCGKSSQSDGTLSSTGRSPSHHRPHSMAARLPNYISDTISSQLRVGRSKEKQSDVASCTVVCSRFRSVSPSKNGRAQSTGTTRRSRAEVEKVFDQLSTPRVAAAPDSNEMSFRQSPSEKIVPAKTMRRARSVSSRPSKILASPVLAPTTGHPRGVNVSLSKQMVVKSAKPVTPLGDATTPSSKTVMPSPPKPMTPRCLPKEPKLMKEVTTSNKPTASNKIKVAHQVNQAQAFSADKQMNDSTEAKEIKEPEIIEQVTIANVVETASPEKTDVMKKSVSGEDEYKLKLAENRRLAREKAERDAEVERLRVEKQRQDEEEKVRREEEEEQRREEEELRLTEEAARLEAQRFQRAVEEEKHRREEEDERLEAERKEKLETEKRAQEEAEKKEKERTEKAKREEEERIERKKRLETIMKRVKTDETPSKTEAVLPVKSAFELSPTTLDNNLEVMTKPATTLTSPTFPAQVEAADNESSQFRSPLLRQMLGNKLKTLSDTETSTATETNLCTSEIGQENCKLALNILQPMQDFSSKDTKPGAELENEIVNFRNEEVNSNDILSESEALLEPSADRMAVYEPLFCPSSNGMRAVESDQAENIDKLDTALLHLDDLSPAVTLPELGSGTGSSDNDDDEKNRFDPLETGKSHEALGLLVAADKKNGTGMLQSASGACNGEGISAITTSDLLIDLSLPSEKPTTGTSVPADMEDSTEMGTTASSALLLPGKITNENHLTGSTEFGTLDEFIDLAMPAQLAVVHDNGFAESVNGQSLTPPNGIPLVAFEDDSNIQFKPLGDAIV